MVALYITSSEKGNGKTTISAGIGKHMLSDGKRVGFLKPVIADKDQPVEGADSDAVFIKQLLALKEPIELICPVFPDENTLRSGIREALARVSQGKDVVIVEGTSGQSQDVAEAIDARVIVIESYSQELPKAVNSYQDLGTHLLGIIFNKVPKNRVEQVRDDMSAQFKQAGINVLGILPEDRTLLAITTGELAGCIQGKILSGAEKSAELVENVMLGALVVDSGKDYFNRKANKAVVLRSERPDMQMAALETSTSCLVITGDTAPQPAVLHHAEEKDVPVIFAADDVTTIVTNIENALVKTRFNQEKKLPKVSEIMRQHFDFQAVYRVLS